MTELKTLKDIEKEPNWDDKIFNAEGIYINIGRLRQEAIKHIKDPKFKKCCCSKWKKLDTEGHCQVKETCPNCHLKNWIIDFFNITEEELI